MVFDGDIKAKDKKNPTQVLVHIIQPNKSDMNWPSPLNGAYW
jgi:hypothetical protein